MSFLDDIIGVGKGIFDFVTGDTTGGAIARAVGSSIVLNQITDSINKDNQKPDAATSNQPDFGVREQVDPDTQHSIPVVYGTAFVGGIVTDAVLTNSNQTMWYCLTICEKTGNLINGTASTITIDRIYWNQSEIKFQTDGTTVDSFIDEDGNVNDNPKGLVQIFLYNNGSVNQTFPAGFSGSTSPAYSLFPNWTANHTMNELVFALVKVNYSKEKSITGLGNIEFKVKNSMTEAGDCINDYLTNTRYGAGITAEEINS
jgi:hypothetical protein